MLVTEGYLEPGEDVPQLLLVLLPHTLLDGLRQVTVAVVLDGRQEHLHGELPVLYQCGVLHHNADLALGPTPLLLVVAVARVQQHPETEHDQHVSHHSGHLAVRAGLLPVCCDILTITPLSSPSRSASETLSEDPGWVMVIADNSVFTSSRLRPCCSHCAQI